MPVLSPPAADDDGSTTSLDALPAWRRATYMPKVAAWDIPLGVMEWQWDNYGTSMICVCGVLCGV